VTLVRDVLARRLDRKIEDLRAVVEQFGKESKNRLKARKAVAPVWVVVTSQEKLDEVVAAIDSKRVELAKLQDRFKYHVDLAPADIREVATKRVLAKKAESVEMLEKLFGQHQGQLNAATRLERTTLKSEVRQDDFVQFYPYLPHFIELSIDIMSEFGCSRAHRSTSAAAIAPSSSRHTRCWSTSAPRSQTNRSAR